MRVFRVPQLNGDGSSAAAQTFPYYPDVDKDGQPFLDDAGQPAIAMELRAVSKAQYREFVKARTTTAANGSGAMVEKIDWELVHEDVVVYAIVSWRGFVGADDKPLACLDGTKRALDSILQNAVRAAATFAQPAEVAAASFRQPARVADVVGGLREDDRVLSAGDAVGARG